MRSLKKRLLALSVVLIAMTLTLPPLALARNDDNSCPGNSCNAPGQTGNASDQLDGTSEQLDDTSDQPGNAPGQLHRLSKGRSDFKGNLKTKQHIYYEGDPLEVSIKFSRGVNLLADGTADAHVVVIAPNTEVFSVPVESVAGANERMFFDFVVATDALPVGQYQLGLIVTVPSGDPTSLLDWYNGFRGLLDMEGIYVSAAPLPEDSDTDGECDFDADGDGFCDDQSQGDDDDDVDDDSLPPVL